MTKWARMRKRKERRMTDASTSSVSEENEPKLVEPKKISNNVDHHQQTQKTDTSNPSTILSQIPRYVYLVAIFALLSGVFFPLITTGADNAYSFVIGGMITLFLGLAGGILIFKATTSSERQRIFLVVGFALIAISLLLIFLIQYWWKMEFIRG